MSPSGKKVSPRPHYDPEDSQINTALHHTSDLDEPVEEEDSDDVNSNKKTEDSGYILFQSEVNPYHAKHSTLYSTEPGKHPPPDDLVRGSCASSSSISSSKKSSSGSMRRRRSGSRSHGSSGSRGSQGSPGSSRNESYYDTDTNNGAAGFDGPAPHEPMYHEYQRNENDENENENTSRSYENENTSRSYENSNCEFGDDDSGVVISTGRTMRMSTLDQEDIVDSGGGESSYEDAVKEHEIEYYSERQLKIPAVDTDDDDERHDHDDPNSHHTKVNIGLMIIVATIATTATNNNNNRSSHG